MNEHQQIQNQAWNGSSDLPSSEGTTLEIPVTHPFEGYTYIKKEWVDQEDGIDKVTFNMTLGHLNAPADWSHTQTFIMMPEWGQIPLKRTWIVRLPTHLDGKDRYLFHYFFQIYYSNGTERVSNAFTQMLMPREFEYIDHSGDFVHVRLYWSVGSWTYPQNTELEVDGIDWGSEFSVSNAPYRGTDRLYHNGRFLVMQRVAIPRRFRGIIWAPKGAEIRYCFQMVRHIGEGFELVWDNNFGKDFCLSI